MSRVTWGVLGHHTITPVHVNGGRKDNQSLSLRLNKKKSQKLPPSCFHGLKKRPSLATGGVRTKNLVNGQRQAPSHAPDQPRWSERYRVRSAPPWKVFFWIDKLSWSKLRSCLKVRHATRLIALSSCFFSPVAMGT